MEAELHAWKKREQEYKEKLQLLEGKAGVRMDQIDVSQINIQWNVGGGTCTFENLPTAMMWIDTTLAGVMAGVQAMVGTERFALALQHEGRKSVRVAETINSTILLVFWSVFRVAPKVTYNKYAPFGAP